MSGQSITGRPRWVTVVLDVTSYMAGLALIGYQCLAVPPAEVNEWFLLLAGSMIGAPGAAEILAMRSRQQRGIGTDAPASSLPASDSSPVQP